MKLLLQSDDYGMTRAVSSGIIFGIEHGIIRNTGMFTNMPFAKEYATWIRPYLGQISFGIDLNITTGSPVLPPEEIPTLVKADGSFYASWERRSLDEEDNGFKASYEEIYKEFEAQVENFFKLMGRKPDYIHSHAYETDLTIQIHRELSKKYGVIYSCDAWRQIVGYEVPEDRINWYVKPVSLENQLKSSLKDYILEHSEALLAEEYCIIIGHMGYVDRELMDISSYNICRLNDLDAVTSPEIINWIKENNVELITYNDIVKGIK